MLSACVYCIGKKKVMVKREVVKFKSLLDECGFGNPLLDKKKSNAYKNFYSLSSIFFMYNFICTMNKKIPSSFLHA